MRHVLESIREWCYPAAEEMPNDPVARCDWYARRLLLIANATRCAKATECSQLTEMPCALRRALGDGHELDCCGASY